MSNREPRQNLELKARCSNPSAVREALGALGASPSGAFSQIDTYFRVPRGRLKLRECDSAPAVLIYYERADDSRIRPSVYWLTQIPEPDALLGTLATALGTIAVVRKRRELWMWHNVRIHIDKVEDLGDFLEFEAVLSVDEPAEVSRPRVERLIATLGVTEDQRINRSYSDLLLATRH
ncbi:MAG: class IV adenylate cyclase [Tepidisphaeraceae bacterium]